MIASGMLDRRLSLYTVSDDVDEFGVSEDSLDFLRTIWGGIFNMRGGESLANGIELNNIDVVFRIRHAPDISDKMVVGYGDKFFDIEFIEEIGRKDELRLYLTLVKLND